MSPRPTTTSLTSNSTSLWLVNLLLQESPHPPKRCGVLGFALISWCRKQPMHWVGISELISRTPNSAAFHVPFMHCGQCCRFPPPGDMRPDLDCAFKQGGSSFSGGQALTRGWGAVFGLVGCLVMVPCFHLKYLNSKCLLWK